MKLKFSLLNLPLAIALAFNSYGQATDIDKEQQGEILEDVAISYPYQVHVIDERDGTPFTIFVQDPEVIQERLSSIENIMPMVYNESVAFWLHFFIERRPSFTKKMMEDTGIYFPIFEKALKEHNMPEELKYLAILESGLNPKAVSRSKAVGLWQFMSFTGKDYGLEINRYIDERMDPEKSTDAACRYLKYLNNMFNDWDLALASYNTGQGRIQRVMKKTGLTNYWDLHPHIHKDTRAYVPQFIALAYLMNFGQDHGIIPDAINTRPATEKIFIDSEIDLDVLASLTFTPVEEIRYFNPHLLDTKLPESRYGYELTLPLSTMACVDEDRVAILDSARKGFWGENMPNPVLLASTDDNSIVIGKAPVVAKNQNQQTITRNVKKIHQVKRGEFLNKIAANYKVSPKEIMRWNNKNTTKVLVGERLTIYVKQTEAVNANSLAAKTSAQNVKQPDSYYTVKRGDTLWNISQRQGVSVNDLKKWNNLKDNRVLVGQKIKVSNS